MSGFAELGLRPELTQAATKAGFDLPTPVQRAAIPVLRRGGNAVLIASSGSGVTAAYVLPLLDRVTTTPAEADGAASPGREAPAGPAAEGDEPALQPAVLVLTATEERAAEVARTFTVLGEPLDVAVRALTVAWSARASDGVLVAPLGSAARALRESRLKLIELRAVVFDNASVLLKLDERSAFEGLAASIPHDAQRIITVSEWNRDVERFAESHARRAITVPPRPADPELAIPPEHIGTLSYIVVSPADKPAALARVLRRTRPTPPVVTVRSQARADFMTQELRRRGFRIAATGEDNSSVDAILTSASANTDGQPLIACDVPFDGASLAAMELTDGLVLVEPQELAHLQRIANEAGIELKAVGARPARGSVAAYREEIRRALREQDVEAQIALLEPLFEEFSAVEVAAALSALLRSRVPAPPQPAAAPAASPAEREPGRPQAFVRLFVGTGQRDNIRKGDILGAITGEAGITGDQVGRIEIRDTFSVVEVASDCADRVIRALNGTTLRGRALRVDYDRRAAPSPKIERRPRATRVRPPSS